MEPVPAWVRSFSREIYRALRTVPTTVNSRTIFSFSSPGSTLSFLPTQSLSPVKVFVSITAHSPALSGYLPSSSSGGYIPEEGRVCIRAVWVSPVSETKTISVS